MGLLNDRVVIVTGSGRGIGRAYAMHAASEGAAVMINDVDGAEAERVAEEIRHAGHTGIADPHSIADPSGAKKLIDHCVDQFGRLDGLVNNAGIHYTVDPWADDEEQIHKIVAINLLGTMYCGLYAIRRMKAQGGGVIVNVTSGAQMGMSRMASYGATKGGVASLTYSWAIDLEQHNIRVNAINPLARTRMGGDRPGGPPWPPEHMAPVCTYLLSDLSSGITGQVVRLDGPLLSIVSHPSVMLPALEKEEWAVEDIRDAFDRDLRHRLAPLGRNSVARYT